jgi:hypothetical protein
VFAQMARLAGDVAVAGGQAVDVMLLHPRRLAWLSETAASPPPSLPGIRFVQVPAMPTDIGTTQDPVIALSLANAVSLFRSPPRFRAMADVLSGTLQMRAEVSGYAALLPRQVKCIGKLTGAALVAPTYS